MKYTEKKVPKYPKCPENVQRSIERIFSRALERCPYPEGIRERINWVHLMEEALRGLEAQLFSQHIHEK